MKFKIFYKFLFLILVVTVLPLLWLGKNLINRAEFSIKTPILELHLNRINSIEKTILNKLLYYDRFNLLIDDFFRSKNDWGTRLNFISSIVNSVDEVNAISILNLKGEEVFSVVKKSYSLKQTNFYLIDELKKKGRKVFIKDNEFFIIYYNFTYLVRFVVNKDIFIKNIGIEVLSKKDRLVFIDENFNVLIRVGEFQNFNVDEILKTKVIKNNIEVEVANGTFEVFYGDKKYLGAVSHIKALDIFIVSLQEESDAFRYAMSIKTEAIKVLLLIIVVVVIASYFLSKNLTSPIIKFINASKRIMEKDFSVRVNISTKDELEDLALNFNMMIEELDKYSKMQIEKILKERQNTQAIMYSTEEGIIMVDMENKVQLINRKAIDIIGADGSSVEGLDLYSSIKNEKVLDAIKTAYHSEKRQTEFEIDFKTYKRFYRVAITDIIMEKTKELIGYLITFYDITYDKELEKMKEDFLHSITHDLRNPVSAIKGFSEFLLKEIAGPLNTNQKNMIVSIDRAAFRLLQMVNNILDIAKMEAGKMDINISKFNIKEVIEKCVELMYAVAQKKNIKFIIDGEDIEINADQNLIERLYVNLIGNAIKFTPQDGTITIAIRKENNKFISWVEDTGEGIPSEYLDKIFSKFEQVKGQKAGGTGLGLAISKYIVEAHLGKIWATNSPGKGAKFIFEFPLNLTKDEFGKVTLK